MGTVALEGMDFFAYHGFYDEEQKIGNKYTVDLIVKTDLSHSGNSDQLDHTVNYEKLYQLVDEAMKISSRLLENVASRIISSTLKAFPFVEKVEVSIIKHNPPVGGVCRQSRITMSREN